MSHSPEDHTLRNPPPGVVWEVPVSAEAMAHTAAQEAVHPTPFPQLEESNLPEDPDPIREALWLIVDREYDIPTNQAMKALDDLQARIKELEAELAEANEVIESAGRGMC